MPTPSDAVSVSTDEALASLRDVVATVLDADTWTNAVGAAVLLRESVAGSVLAGPVEAAVLRAADPSSTTNTVGTVMLVRDELAAVGVLLG